VSITAEASPAVPLQATWHEEALQAPAAVPPQSVAAPIHSAGARRHLFALAGDGYPARLDTEDTEDVSAYPEIGEWLKGLGTAAWGTLALATADEPGATSPRPNAWTKIGSATMSVKGMAMYTAVWGGQDTERHAGTTTAGIEVFRLSSIDSFDYYLVKTRLSSRAECQREDYFAAFFWTTYQGYRATLRARTVGGTVHQGRLREAAPETIAGSTEYKMIIGSELNASVDKDGVKGGGKVTASMETTWRVNDVNVTQADVNNYADWRLAFPVLLIKGIHDAAKGLTVSTHAIFEFPRTINDGGPPTLVVNADMWGGFASMRNRFGYTEVLGHPYPPNSSEYTFPVPQFSVTPSELSVRKDGVPAKLTIHASTGPLELQWKVADIPPSLQLSKMEGSGDVTIDVYATNSATPSPIPQIIRINSVPATAADSLRNGAVPIAVFIRD
jgi:hypothetical protein